MAQRQRDLQAEAERAVMACLAVAYACQDGRHRTETDAETGDEVCRYCGAVSRG
jgi:hypothetical protein